MLPSRYTVVDVETTGLSPYDNRIIEIGIVRVEDGEIVETFESLVNPRASLSSTITRITGITSADIVDAPYFEDIAIEVISLFEDSILVAHNAAFDLQFLHFEFNRLGISFHPKELCTVRLSRRLFPEHKRHGLDAQIERYGLTIHDRHRALGDTLATQQLLEVFSELLDEDTFNKHVKTLLSQPTKISKTIWQDIDDLPTAPGVYTFTDEKKKPLYIGKSIDIKSRVNQHFSRARFDQKERELCSKTKHITYEKTAGEIGALVLESRKIKDVSPPYNRALKRVQSMVIAVIHTSSSGYKTLTYERVSYISSQRLGSIAGVYSSIKQAKAKVAEISKEYCLCNKLLGIEAGSGACFSYHLGKCSGACVNEGTVISYNKKFDHAFAESMMLEWPFGDYVIIGETNVGNTFTDILYVDSWRVFDALDDRDDKTPIDVDTYRILLRSFKSYESSSPVSFVVQKKKITADQLKVFLQSS